MSSLRFDLDGVVAVPPSSPLLFRIEEVAADEPATAGDGAKFFLRGIWNSSMILVAFANKRVVSGMLQVACSVIG
jgi:hypothetical protein